MAGVAVGSRMHQTTVRFSADLWEQLQVAAADSGVSAAQFVRDAALTRLAFAAGEREGRAEGERETAADNSVEDARERAVEVQSGPLR